MPRAKFQINNYNKSKLAAIFSCAAIFIGGVYFFQPFSFTENTNAATERTANGDYYIETTATDLNLTIHTTPAGAQETASHNVTVKTDDPAGYTLTVSVDNDTSNALNLNGNTTATEKFNATSGTYASPKALDENSWGFADTLTKKNNNQWAAVPLLKDAQQLKQTSSANTSGDTTTVYYGINAKYDGKHSNGDYSNTIVYSVTGNTIPVTYMQDMTASDCAALDIYDPTNATTQANTTYTVVDKRDNQEYKIRRLKMGTGSDTACWMVENLKLTGARTLTSSDSNVSSDFDLTTSDSGTWCNDNNATCNNQSMVISTDYGALYNWYAATAGTGTYSISSGAVPASICPGKGAGTDTATKTWHLPTGSSGKEWYKLFTAYRSEYGWSTIDGNSNTGTMTKIWNQDIGPAFIYSGRRNGANTNEQSSTGEGYWWSSTRGGSGSAYNAFLEYRYRNVRGGTHIINSYVGLAVRCVLPAS